jgi:hypothetical protein
MDNIYIIAAVISIVFLIVKFIEMRFVDKENKPLKYMLRDTLLVYISVVLGNFVLEQSSLNVTNVPITQVFTDMPEF